MAEAAPKGKPDFNARKTFFMNLFWVVLIGLVTLLIYKNVYRADFFLDDYLHLHLVNKIDNPLIPFVSNLFMGAFFRPGVFIFWQINHLVFGLNAGGYYATNMILLLALIGLFYFSLHNLTGHRIFSTAGTALFAFSPITSVGVLWLSNRFDLIGSVFYMLSLFLFLRYLRTRKRNLYVWSILAGFFSYFCKEMMITLPVVMVICSSFMFSYRATLSWRRLREIVALTTPFFTLGVLFMLWRYGVIHSLGGYSGEIKVKLSAAYIQLLYENFADYFWLMRSKFVFAVYLILFFLLLAKNDFLKNNPLSILGSVIALITFLPLIMIFQMQAVMSFMTPRFFFLPSIGMIILLASVYDPRSGRVRKVLALIFLSVTMLIFAINTFVITYKWSEDRRENVRSMKRIHDYLNQQGAEVKPGQLFYVMLYGNDVALDAGMKLRYPQYLDRCYFINPKGPTQVIAKEGLHRARGTLLIWPNTFNRNPCDYEDLFYGVIDTSPREIMSRMTESDDVVLIHKDKMGKLMTADRESVSNLLVTLGVVPK